jgi:catechol 2,3-dioxygenase-like lactoylglutathione lyase family enzyme
LPSPTDKPDLKTSANPWAAVSPPDPAAALPLLPVESREQLVYLLTQACELEQGVLCEYLFALYSLKHGRRRGCRRVCGETGDQTGQESRSAAPRAAGSVTAMDITIHASFLPRDDPEASLAFYRDILGFQGRNDVGRYGGMRWIMVGPADRPGRSIVLQPPAPPVCGLTRTILRQPVRRTQIPRSSRVGGRRTAARSTKPTQPDEANAGEEANAEQMTTTHKRHKAQSTQRGWTE